MKPTISIEQGFSSQLMRTNQILRLGCRALCIFLQNYNNPCLKLGNLPHTDFNQPHYNVRHHLYDDYYKNPPSDNVRPYIEALIECVNDDGYLELPPDIIAATQRPKGFDDAILYLQSMACPGVGAQTLEQCLMLQLEKLPNTPHHQAACHLVRNYLPWVRKKRLDKLPKKYLAEALSLIEQLSETPGRAYASPATPTFPDVVFVKRGGLWHAQEGAGLQINVMVNKTINANHQQQQRAQEIVNAVRNRCRLVLKVAQIAADRQSQFFEQEEALAALTLQTVAEYMTTSPAFISHIVADKIVIVNHRSLPLKQLFPRPAGDHTNSSTIREKICRLIRNENPKSPLNDKTLHQQLNESGIQLSPRTVRWYRQMIGFPPASKRKRLPINSSF